MDDAIPEIPSFSITMRLRTVSMANVREHWAVRAKRSLFLFALTAQCSRTLAIETVRKRMVIENEGISGIASSGISAPSPWHGIW